MTDTKPPVLENVAPDVQSSTPSSSDMLFYYQRFLPFKAVFQWLSHSPKPTADFTMREFAYEYRSGAYQRYNSYATSEEFKEAVCRANPMRFEVGAVYAVNPKDRKTLPKSAMRPLAKELVFDIDLTDYDEIRTCCSKTDICEKCWKFITVATRIIDGALREDFGFEHLIWVFSGRRGAHCWVSDQRARNLDETARRAIVEYMDVLKTKTNKRISVRRPFHPLVERSFDVLKTEFQEIILEDQDPWRDLEKAKEMAQLLPDKTLIAELTKKWSEGRSSSKAKWEDINTVAAKVLPKNFKTELLNEAKKDIIISTLYPRLDVEVSRQVIHLLKSPFCIHPSTGNICVPFDPRDGDFHPTKSPNLAQLLEELEAWDENPDNADIGKKLADWEKTSMKPYVDLFRKFVAGLLKDEFKGKREREGTDF
ncbi:hypothetical protein BABINDRAFT_161456 [Babjeviella inositovora NRRL Y-12698]|uniref:DNA primase n=1 Tax=Babjeviella inositovora NRRL Y-12698 TaxID=984486 RepID=A0A1E3QPX3_9ASCO|nr:uncharacterized protein BABINDRAFT_161456 [Babjeviella inositovora NRRL Y-12698]ODQ79756.1 hypothetical protein BABINDRAFT_161456 [Babjeviella inositovora NRRL Y-12698]